jgi:two-component system, NarL family, nitrate/nitrite response regulator NarL
VIRRLAEATVVDESERLITEREREIVQLVCQGLRNRDIAKMLNLTEGTVKVYLHNLYRKTGILNRTELAMRASELTRRGQEFSLERVSKKRR